METDSKNRKVSPSASILTGKNRILKDLLKEIGPPEKKRYYLKNGSAV